MSRIVSMSGSLSPLSADAQTSPSRLEQLPQRQSWDPSLKSSFLVCCGAGLLLPHHVFEFGQHPELPSNSLEIEMIVEQVVPMEIDGVVPAKVRFSASAAGNLHNLCVFSKLAVDPLDQRTLRHRNGGLASRPASMRLAMTDPKIDVAEVARALTEMFEHPPTKARASLTWKRSSTFFRSSSQASP